MYNLALFQVLLLVVSSCFDRSRGSQQISCKDEARTQPVPSFLSSFTSHRGHRSFSEDFRGIWFYIDSLEECAQFCLLTTEENIFNCTGFQYQHGGKCLLKTSGCFQRPVLENNTGYSNSSSIISRFYIRKEYNASNECMNSTATSSTLLPSKQGSILVINITACLLDFRWQDDLSNISSLAFKNLSWSLKNNIYQLYDNDSTPLDVVFLQFSNFSMQVLSTFSVHFNESSRMPQFTILYRALYRTNKIHNISIKPLTDNLPGKPPTSLTTIISDSTADISWAHAYLDDTIPTLGYKVTYSIERTNTWNVMVLDYITKYVQLKYLRPSSNYTIRITSITARGFGEPSLSLVIRTTNKVEIPMVVNVTLNLKEETWSEDLSNKTHPAYMALRTRLQNNINLIYKNHVLKEIVIYGFRKTNNTANSNVQANFGMMFDSEAMVTKDLEPIYNALYRNNKLSNISVEVLQDNIPGKPPTNISWTSSTPHSITVKWNPAPQQCGYFIFYKLKDSLSLHNIFNKTVNSSSTHLIIHQLQPFSYYYIWIQSITTRGLGLASDVILARSLEETLVVNLPFLLLNNTWNINLSNPFDVEYKRLQYLIQTQLELLYTNNSQFRDVKCCTFRNFSNITIADLSVTFGQDVSMGHFSVLYDAVYIKRRIGDLQVQPVNDTLPGKPPLDITANPTGTTSVKVTWSLNHQILPREWLLFYDLIDTHNATVLNLTKSVNQRANRTSLANLEKFSYYVIWVRGVTQWGLGIPSEKIIVRTLEEVLPVNVILVLPNIPWDPTLLNSTSLYYQNMSLRIEYNIQRLYGNGTHLKDGMLIKFRNESNVTVDISMVFSQSARAQELNKLYEVIYRKQRIHQLDVKPFEDTIPGKPPDHVTSRPNSTTSILLSWKTNPTDKGLETLGFKISYMLTSSRDNLSSLETGANVTWVLLENLEKFRKYTFWVSSVTRIGAGSLSISSSARTLEEEQPIDLVLRFPLLMWNENLSIPGSEEFKNLSKIIEQNVFRLYSDNDTQLRRVICKGFTNGSVVANITIVYGQHVSMEHFAKLYRAIYVDGQLYNLTTQALRDNVPGKPPVNVNAEILSSTSLQVTWSCSDCAHTNNTIAFLVSYRRNSSDTNVTQGIVVNSTNRHVIITRLRKFTKYMFWVTSVTSRGNGIASDIIYNTTLEDIPSKAPTNVSAYNTSSTTIMVDWGQVPIGYVHGILQGYIIEYKKQHNSSDQWKNITVNNSTVKELAGLEKYTMYVIRVMAFTSMGRGPAANVSVSTDEDVPSSPPADIRAVNTSSTSIRVTWAQVRPGFAHGIVLGYHILYRRSNDSNTSHVIETTHAYNFTFVLRRLNKYTEYRIKMIAFTKKGNGSVSDEISVYTDEDTPSLPPPNVQSYNTSSTSLNVTWGQIPTYYIHGILRGYRVLYKDTRDVNGSYSNVTTLANYYEIRGLRKFTKYSLKVLGYTVKGDGVESDAVNVTTDEDVPSRAPLNVSGHNTSSTSLFLKWNQVPHGYVHGILRGYKVLYKIDNEKSSNYTYILTVNTTRIAVLSNLKKFTIYRITVLAFTIKGNGPAAVNITVTTDEDIPSRAPTNLTAHNTSSTSFMVNWDPVPEGQLHGILRGYRVLYKMAANTSSNFTSLTTDPTPRRLNISSLKKFTVYLVKVLAFTVKGDGPLTVNISVSTDEDVPSKPPEIVQSFNTSSTTLNVTWSDIPECCVHGILLGYRVHYRLHKLRSERSVNNYRTETVPSPTSFHVQLEGLKKFAIYEIQVLGYTRIGDGAASQALHVTTDEDIPSMPPDDLSAYNTSSTSLFVSWKDVPKGFVHGILLGYRLQYKIASDHTSYVTKVMSRGSNQVTLTGLLKYTNYDIRVSAFTRIGNGPNATTTVKTDEDVPSKTPQDASPANHANSTTIPVKWSHIPQPYVHGILRGYHVLYKLITLADVAINNAQYKSVTVAFNETANVTTVTLKSLESFAVYEIKIAGFTSKGDGKWAIFNAKTCRCHPYISTNWWAHPPYVRKYVASNETTFNGLLTPIGGIFPPILLSSIKKCCEGCPVGSTTLDFKYDGHDKKAQKDGLLDVKDKIDGKSFISFPVGGTKDQTKYIGVGGEYEFVSIMDMPGAAFLVADRREIHREVLNAILSCWPTVIFVFIVAYLAGAAIWLIDVHSNPEHFPRSFIGGTIEGFWWAFITMTTVGYGDRIPKSVVARLFAIVWIWMGIATIAVLTSSITASLMSMVFKSDIKLYGAKVAAIDNSSEYKLGVRRNSILVGRYGNIYDIHRDLKAEVVHAALLDSYATASEEKLFSESWLRVREVIKTGFESTNGVVLGGDAQKLGNCMRNFMTSEENSIHKIVQRNVKTIQASKIPPAIKTSSSLLTSKSNLFKLTAFILGLSLAIFVVIALMWEFGYRRRTTKEMTKKNNNNNNRDIEGSWPLWAKLPAKQRYEMIKRQMRADLTDFYDKFRRTYEELRHKHSLQMAALRNQKKGVFYFSVNEWTGGRSATYAVTKDGDINSILDGLDLSMFDGNETEKKKKLGF